MFLTSSGKFIAHLDDDDDISDDYLIDIINAIKTNPNAHVITFKQEYYIKEKIFCCFWSRIPPQYGYPLIWCVWNSDKINQINFKKILGKNNYGEEGLLLNLFKDSELFSKETKINKILHYYNYDKNR